MQPSLGKWEHMRQFLALPNVYVWQLIIPLRSKIHILPSANSYYAFFKHSCYLFWECLYFLSIGLYGSPRGEARDWKILLGGLWAFHTWLGSAHIGYPVVQPLERITLFIAVFCFWPSFFKKQQLCHYRYKDLFKTFINNLKAVGEKFNEKKHRSLVTTNNRQILTCRKQTSFLNSQFNNPLGLIPEFHPGPGWFSPHFECGIFPLLKDHIILSSSVPNIPDTWMPFYFWPPAVRGSLSGTQEQPLTVDRVLRGPLSHTLWILCPF